MLLPNGNQAVVDIAKLREYCINTNHPFGKFKARVFASALGLAADDAPLLATWLLHAPQVEETQLGRTDVYGQRYIVDFYATHLGRTSRIRSCWIILAMENFPRLVTCYVL